MHDCVWTRAVFIVWNLLEDTAQLQPWPRSLAYCQEVKGIRIGLNLCSKTVSWADVLFAYSCTATSPFLQWKVFGHNFEKFRTLAVLFNLYKAWIAWKNRKAVLGWLCYTVLAKNFEKITQITIIYTKVCSTRSCNGWNVVQRWNYGLISAYVDVSADRNLYNAVLTNIHNWRQCIIRK